MLVAATLAWQTSSVGLRVGDGGHMAVESNFVAVRAAPLGAGDPGHLGPFQLVGRLSHRPTTTSYLGVDVLRRMAVVSTFRAAGRIDIGRQELEDSLAAARRVVGSSVATVLDSGWDDGAPWVALRYVPGTTATEHFAEHGPLEPDQLLPFAGAIAAGLRSLHGVGVIHGDLGPHHVTLTARGPVLVGFGGPPAAKGHRRGPWLPPEVARKGPSTAGDVYAWGWLVAAAALGPDQVVFKELRRGSRLPSMNLSALPAPLPALVEQALHPYPSARPDAERLCASLPLRQWPPRRLAPVLLAPPGFRPPTPGRLRRRLATATVTALTIAASLAAVLAAR